MPLVTQTGPRLRAVIATQQGVGNFGAGAGAPGDGRDGGFGLADSSRNQA